MFGLTTEERKALVFLCSVFLLGWGVRFCFKNMPCKRSIGFLNTQAAKLDLNKANKADLMRAKGIGDKLSDRIISLRQARGKFLSIEEIKEIKGITQERFCSMQEYFFVE